MMKNLASYVPNAIGLLIGTILFSISIELFLVPNKVIDGGIVGISIITSQLAHVPFGLLLFILNIPFLLLGYKKVGKSFAIISLFTISCGSIFSSLLHHVNPITNDVFIATIFGGVLLGVGVGLVIRNGGSLDGTEISAILATKKLPFSVGEIVLFFNVFIFMLAGLVFGWDRAGYSFIAYYIAYKMIDMTIDGFQDTRSVWIISDKPNEIGEALLAKMGRGVTYFHGEGGFSNQQKKIILSVITRLEEKTLKNIVLAVDKDAFIAVGHIHDVSNGGFEKKLGH